MTDRNVLHTRIDVSAGKMIRLEIKRAPIIRIPSTVSYTHLRAHET